MSLLSPSRGLSITNPLILYRALLATKKIHADPAQHRLALHLQKLYNRLKDYNPELDYSYRLSQVTRTIGRPLVQPSEEKDREGPSKNESRRSILSSIWNQKPQKDTFAVIKRLTDHESAIGIQSPQGLLLYGEVGTGKSMLVDLLADCLPNEKKRRWHFNTFMLHTFAELEQLRRKRLKLLAYSKGDNQEDEHSLLWLAREMISKSPILFLDEFQLPDRAASKILSILFTSFFHLGGVLIATSNRMPEELANASGVEFAAAPPSSPLGFWGNRWGLLSSSEGMTGTRKNELSANRDFATFLEVLRARCEIWDMEGKIDWRRYDTHGEEEEGINMINDVEEQHNFRALGPKAPSDWSLRYEQSKITTLENIPKPDETKHGESLLPKFYLVRPPSSTPGDIALNANMRWEKTLLSCLPSLPNPPNSIAEIPWTTSSLQVYGRYLLIPRILSGITYWTFPELCSTNLGPADYISLASNFHTIILADVPVLSLLQKNEARRLITLLDALYEARCKLLVRAEAGPDGIFFPPNQQNTTEFTPADSVYPETFSEIYQDSTSPFRPNISSYTPSASPPSYHSSPIPSTRSILADEDSDFGPEYSASRSPGSLPRGPSDGAPGAGNEIGAPDFTRTGAFTGEDERFAYKRARSRLWEMCGARWWSRNEDGWWSPVAKSVRRWERACGESSMQDGDGAAVGARNEDDRGAKEDLFRHGASPFRVSREPPPKIGWTHAWGMMTWGRKAGAWGKGVEGLAERRGGGGVGGSTVGKEE